MSSIAQILNGRPLMPKLREAANFRINRLSERILRAWMVRIGWQPSGVSPVSELQIESCFGYDEEAAIKHAAAIVMNHTMVSFHRLAALWAQVRYLDRYGLAGSMVECGVWRGGAAGLMALAHLHGHLGNPAAANRELHLFDSWEGLPE